MTRTGTLIKYPLIVFVILSCGIASTADAFDWYVPTDFPTIQEAINASSNTDTINVIGDLMNPTVHMEHDIDFNGKNVRVQAWDALLGRSEPGSVIIDCQGLGRAFIFQSGETLPFAELNGFIIRNGYAKDLNWPQDPSVDASGYGGAIYCKGSSPRIINCEIYDCISDAGGGAIFCDENSDARISFCDIGINTGSYNFAGWGFYQYIDINDVNDVDALDVNDLHQFGGGIYCRNSNPQIINCNINYNVVAGSGGGIACVNSDAIIRDCNIWENDAWVNDDRIDQHGGGIYIKDCKGRGPEIQRGTIIWNTARWSGGGIAVIDSNSLITGLILPQKPKPIEIYDNHCWASAGGIYSQGNPHSDPNTDPNKPNVFIQYCNIAQNWGYWSGGVSSNYGSSMDIDNSNIAWNIASWSWLVGGLETYGGSANLTGTNIWGNTGVPVSPPGMLASALGMEFSSLEMAGSGGNSAINATYSNVQMFDSQGYYDPCAVWPGEGNINKDPMFVNPILWPYDFHLRSGPDEWNTSPSINAGDPFADYSEEPAPNGGRINIGGYGGTREATSSDILRPVPSDADADLEVNMVDFAILADNWGLEGENIKNKKADADNNNIVDGRDLSILNKFWLWLQ